MRVSDRLKVNLQALFQPAYVDLGGGFWCEHSVSLNVGNVVGQVRFAIGIYKSVASVRNTVRAFDLVLEVMVHRFLHIQPILEGSFVEFAVEVGVGVLFNVDVDIQGAIVD